MTRALFRIIENSKLIGVKLQEANRNHPQLQKKCNQINVEFRTMDKDINTVRPLLMKLQREKDQYTRYNATKMFLTLNSENLFRKIPYISNSK